MGLLFALIYICKCCTSVCFVDICYVFYYLCLQWLYLFSDCFICLSIQYLHWKVLSSQLLICVILIFGLTCLKGSYDHKSLSKPYPINLVHFCEVYFSIHSFRRLKSFVTTHITTQHAASNCTPISAEVLFLVFYLQPILNESILFLLYSSHLQIFLSCTCQVITHEAHAQLTLKLIQLYLKLWVIYALRVTPRLGLSMNLGLTRICLTAFGNQGFGLSNKPNWLCPDLDIVPRFLIGLDLDLGSRPVGLQLDI